MRSSEVLFERSPSDYSPLATRVTVCVKELTDALDKIVRGHLAGFVTLKVRGESLDSVSISAYYTAHTLRLMAKHSGPCGVRVEVDITDRLVISCSFPAGLPQGARRADIYSAALKTGFSVTEDDNCIKLKCRIAKSRIMSLYAKDKSVVMDAFCEAFSEEPLL